MVVKFTDERCKLVEYQKYQDISCFEIQLRTVLQHAWAEVEHGLGYKSYYEPPMDIKRKLNRLAGTLEILDEEFEAIRMRSLYNQSMNKVEKILKQISIGILSPPLRTKSELLQRWVKQVADKYHFTIVHDPAIFSQQRLVAKLNFYGYQYIHELNDDMQQYQNLFLPSEKNSPGRSL